MTAIERGPVARDAQSAALAWRPQRFTESGGDVNDPLIEPLWTGLRVLAHVDATTGATFRDVDGDIVEEFPDVAEELRAALLADRLILDGYLTHQALQEPAAIARRAAELDVVGADIDAYQDKVAHMAEVGIFGPEQLRQVIVDRIAAWGLTDEPALAQFTQR